MARARVRAAGPAGAGVRARGRGPRPLSPPTPGRLRRRPRPRRQSQPRRRPRSRRRRRRRLPGPRPGRAAATGTVAGTVAARGTATEVTTPSGTPLRRWPPPGGPSGTADGPPPAAEPFASPGGATTDAVERWLDRELARLVLGPHPRRPGSVQPRPGVTEGPARVLAAGAGSADRAGGDVGGAEPWVPPRWSVAARPRHRPTVRFGWRTWSRRPLAASAPSVRATGPPPPVRLRSSCPLPPGPWPRPYRDGLSPTPSSPGAQPGDRARDGEWPSGRTRSRRAHLPSTPQRATRAPAGGGASTDLATRDRVLARPRAFLEVRGRLGEGKPT